jgi:tRNA pseudouridine55 synthase
MNGALIIDKPEGITSHDVVARARRILKTKRVGHTGTLDPFATGVLILLVGQATRLAKFIDKDEKEYEALVRFGYETDTGDKTGIEKPESKIQNEDPARMLNGVDWDSVLREFRGEIEQVPPMYSAKKVGGRKLYELARQGQEVARAPAKVLINEIEVLQEIPDPNTEIVLRIVCSAGTYIRTLAEDIGREVGVGAHLQELRRIRAGRFDVSRVVTLEKLGSMEDPSALLIPLSEIVSHLPKVVLTDNRIEKTRQGMSSRTEETFADNEPVRILDPQENLVAIGVFNEAEKSVWPKIVLV